MVIDAKKSTIAEADVGAVLKEVDQIYSTRGRTVEHLDLKRDKPSKAQIRHAIIGPSGNLRAPAVRLGRTLLIGFEEGMYDQLLEP